VGTSLIPYFNPSVQDPEDTWGQGPATGTGFPGVLYLRYDYYRLYWPLRALAIYASGLRPLPVSRCT
jgi:squalene cyclase